MIKEDNCPINPGWTDILREQGWERSGFTEGTEGEPMEYYEHPNYPRHMIFVHGMTENWMEESWDHLHSYRQDFGPQSAYDPVCNSVETDKDEYDTPLYGTRNLAEHLFLFHRDTSVPSADNQTPLRPRRFLDYSMWWKYTNWDHHEAKGVVGG